MNIENQVCSLELARKLKKLGIKQESLVFWLKIQSVVHFKRNEKNECEFDENGGVIVENIEYEYQLGNPYAQYVSKEDCWSAFTVAELCDFLPGWLKIGHHLMIIKSSGWFVTYRGSAANLPAPPNKEIEGDKLADLLAEMIIYLIENKLMELPQ